MPEFTTDLLPDLLVGRTSWQVKLSRARPACCRCLPSRQYLIPYLRIPMPQPVHIAQPRGLALSIVDMPLLDVGLISRDQRAGAGQSAGIVEDNALLRRGDRHGTFAAAFSP